MTTQVLGYKEASKPVFLKEVVTMILASLLIALFTNCRIFLPFTPVPIALQPHVILLLGVVLGSRRATMATLSWMGQGLFGLPVFSGGLVGMAAIAGPTGGYLLGYVAAVYITGWIMERSGEKSMRDIVLAMVTGNVIIYLFGALKLSLLVGLKTSVLIGVLPFILGDLVKLFLASKLFAVSKRVFG